MFEIEQIFIPATCPVADGYFSSPSLFKLFLESMEILFRLHYVEDLWYWKFDAIWLFGLYYFIEMNVTPYSKTYHLTSLVILSVGFDDFSVAAWR